MKKLWRKFVRWLAKDELDDVAAFYRYQICEYETSWRRTTEALALERDAYKQRYEYILKLQAEALSLQPMQPIIIRKDSLGSSAAEVAAKQSKGGMTHEH